MTGRSPRLHALALSGLAVVSGCTQGGGGGRRAADEDHALEVRTFPPVAGQGTTTTLRIDASRSILAFGDTTLGGANDLEIGEVTVHDGWSATVQVTVPDEAPLGARTLEIAAGDLSWTLPGALVVVADSVAVEPDHAKLGELLTVTVTGRATDFREGLTWASAGDGITTIDVEVLSATEALVTLAVAPDAVPGLRPFSVESGPTRVVAYDGFNVDRAGVGATFEPPEVYQDSAVTFTLRGADTTWLTGQRVPDGQGGTEWVGRSEVQFWDGGGANADISVSELRVVDAETITGTLRVSNAAALGKRDVFVTGLEDLLVPDAITVLDTPADTRAAATGLSFDVERTIDWETGRVREEVSAFGYFVIPLNPPCTQDRVPADGPQGFDASGVFTVPEQPPPNDCPNPETVSGGDRIWLESEHNIIPMYKDVIASTGQIIYVSRDLTLEDYHFDTWYDLRIEGDPFGVPAAWIPRVLSTVPEDLVITQPTLCCDQTHDRGTDLALRWNPARTYPIATLYMRLTGELQSDGSAAFIPAYPWDDGAHAFEAAHLSQLAPGPVGFRASVSIDGPPFGLPDSWIQSTTASSTVSVEGSLVLQ